MFQKKNLEFPKLQIQVPCRNEFVQAWIPSGATSENLNSDV